MNSKSFPPRTELIAVILVVVGLGAVVKLGSGEKQAGSLCQSRLKQMGFAMGLYVRDYDEVFPIAAKWDALSPYARGNELFHCPSVPNGYAMNTHLDRASASAITNPATMPEFFDSTIGRKNAHDTGQSWPSPPRHSRGNGVVFVDGHAAWLSRRPAFTPPRRARPTARKR